MSNAREVIALELWRCKDRADDKGNKLTSNQFSDAIIAALSAAGLVIVPKEPTEKMMQAALRYVDDDTQDALPHGVWQVMVEAATDE